MMKSSVALGTAPAVGSQHHGWACSRPSSLGPDLVSSESQRARGSRMQARHAAFACKRMGVDALVPTRVDREGRFVRPSTQPRRRRQRQRRRRWLCGKAIHETPCDSGHTGRSKRGARQSVDGAGGTLRGLPSTAEQAQLRCCGWLKPICTRHCYGVMPTAMLPLPDRFRRPSSTPPAQPHRSSPGTAPGPLLASAGSVLVQCPGRHTPLAHVDRKGTRPRGRQAEAAESANVHLHTCSAGLVLCPLHPVSGSSLSASRSMSVFCSARLRSSVFWPPSSQVNVVLVC
ncbi:hypothetical protein BD289DRAFT_14941 [Coniella lustricola]|uniref:Uncharacterized protein n=1 Tax=Coniella lustricola TaxID=2025994 RepID=A0A2T3A3Z7_9PEZI|nr:hypothetical protein BD289DRAFT_14941 [Coniella lustricola]